MSWQVTPKQATIMGYACAKATTRYAGRDYEAWFTPEIPISDGPYVFSGLPGLVIKLNDTRNHYVFTLEAFGPYSGRLTETPTYRKRQPIAISQQKLFSLRQDKRKDPLGHLSQSTGISFEGATFQRHGSSTVQPLKSAVPDRSWDNNPLELR